MRARTWQVWATAALVAPLTVGGCERAAAPEEQAAAQAGEAERIAVAMATARGQARPVALTLDGTLVADAESKVTSVVAGRVVEVMVERGAKVDKGDPLLRLRDVDYRLQAKAARAQLEQARARLGMASGERPPEPTSLPEVEAAKSEMELAQQDLARVEALAESGAVSPQELDAARSRAVALQNRYQNAVNQAQAAVSSLDAARVSLDQASTAVSEATVRAPFSGEVATRMVSVGEYVGPQTPLVDLVRTDPLRIELSVPQQHLQSVQPGQTVVLRVDALPNRTFEATVRYVSAAVTRDTRALTVEAVVPNPDGVLRPGLYATARLQTGGEEQVAVVPASAVRTSAGVSRVFVVDGGVIQERVVSVAERTGDEVTIAEGLEPGARVATSRLDELADGVLVEPAEGKA